MLTDKQRTVFRQLEKEVNKRDKYLNWMPRLVKLSLFILVIGFLFFILGYFVFKDPIGAIIFAGLFLVFFFMWMFADSMPRIAKLKGPSPDKLTMYYTYASLNDLECYFNEDIADSPEEKDKFKNKVLENTTELLSVVEEDWYIGDFKLGKKVLGEVISEFQQRLSKRLIPNIVTASPDFLKQVENVLYNFAVFLDNPTPEALQHINTMMENIEEITTPEEKSLWTSFMEQPPHIKAVVITGLLTLIIPIFTYQIALTYFHLEVADAFQALVTLAGTFGAVLIAEIISILRSKQTVPPKSSLEKTDADT